MANTFSEDITFPATPSERYARWWYEEYVRASPIRSFSYVECGILVAFARDFAKVMKSDEGAKTNEDRGMGNDGRS